jgi:hypothetical protein
MTSGKKISQHQTLCARDFKTEKIIHKREPSQRQNSGMAPFLVEMSGKRISRNTISRFSQTFVISCVTIHKPILQELSLFSLGQWLHDF